METDTKPRIAGELIARTAIKKETEWLPEDMEFQELDAQMDVQSMERSDSKPVVNTFQGCVLIPQTYTQYLKSQLVLDKEPIDAAKKPKQDVPEIADDQQLTSDSTAENDNPTCEFSIKIHPKESTETEKNLKHCGKTYQCEFCPRSFILKSHFTRHSRVHDDNSRCSYTCEQCGRDFLHKYSFKRHMTTHLEHRKQEFNCQLCERQFFSSHGLELHMRAHTGLTYNCEVCGTRFTQKQNLKMHMLRKHSELNLASETPNDASINIKTELMSEEEFVDEDGSDSAQGSQPCTLATDDEQRTRLNLAEKGSVACELCHNLYPKELIKTHVRMEHSARRYKCDLCQRTFKQKCNLNDHLPTHAKDRKREFACHSCKRAFYTKGHLAIHMKIHTGDTYNCELCGARFTQRGNLKAHMLRQHSDESSQCTSSNPSVHTKIDSTSDEEFLDENTSQTQGSQQGRVSTADTRGETCELNQTQQNCERIFTCEFCPRYFKKIGNLKRHKVTHSDDRKRDFACNSCERTFYTKANLSQHVKTHSGDSLKCEACGAQFMHKQHLNSHILLEHLGEIQRSNAGAQGPNDAPVHTKRELISAEKVLRPEDATDSANGSLKTTLAVDYEQRIKVSIAEKDSVTCELCYNIFPKRLIKTHKRLTHSVRAIRLTLKCELCPRVFINKSQLARHMSSHDGNRPRIFVCGQCGLRFYANYILKRHLLTHSKNRKREFKCQLCERAFFRKEGLVRHLRVHTGDTYNCQVCGARFTQNGSLKTHTLRKHSGEGHQTNPDPQTANYHFVQTKIELISDEEFLDDGNTSDSVIFQENQ